MPRDDGGAAVEVVLAGNRRGRIVETIRAGEVRGCPPAGEGETGAQIALPGLEPAIEGRRDPVDFAEAMARSIMEQRPSGTITLHGPRSNAELLDKLRHLLKEAGIDVT